jgi:hypothetical protein
MHRERLDPYITMPGRASALTASTICSGLRTMSSSLDGRRTEETLEGQQVRPSRRLLRGAELSRSL